MIKKKQLHILFLILRNYSCVIGFFQKSIIYVILLWNFNDFFFFKKRGEQNMQLKRH